MTGVTDFPRYVVTDYKIGASFVSTSLVAESSHYMAAEKLSLNVTFYQRGIARVVIDEVGGYERRFKISDFKDFVVAEEQLLPQ